MFKSSLQSKTAGLPSAIPFLTVLRSLLSKLFVCDSLNRLEFILLESFKVVSLFSYQGSVAVNSNSDIISLTGYCVNNFFEDFQTFLFVIFLCLLPFCVS